MQIKGICIMTDDVKRLATFYESVFNTTSEGDEGHSTMTLGDMGIAFWKYPGSELFSHRDAKDIRKYMYGIMISSEDIASDYQRAIAAGAHIHEKLEIQPWGVKAFVFLDPDGNRVDVFGN